MKKKQKKPKTSEKNKQRLLESDKKYLTEEEVRKLKKELKEYYNFYKGVTVRELTYEEMLDGLGILIELGESKEEQKRFISQCTKEEKTELDIVTKYRNNREKMFFYYEEEELVDIEEYFRGAEEENALAVLLVDKLEELSKQEPTEDVLECIKECLAKINDSKEKYDVYCEFLKEEYFQLETKIRYKIDYEVESAKKLRMGK